MSQSAKPTGKSVRQWQKTLDGSLLTTTTGEGKTLELPTEILRLLDLKQRKANTKEVPHTYLPQS
jgi:hypothetical protein